MLIIHLIQRVYALGFIVNKFYGKTPVESMIFLYIIFILNII